MKRLQRSKFVSDMVALACGHVLSKLLGFLAFAYLARTLGPTTYGSVEFAASLAIFFALIVDCGLGAIGVREVGKTPAKISQLAAQIPTIRFLIALTVFPVMGLFGLLANQDFDTVMMTWMFAFSLIAVPWKQPWMLQSRDRMLAVAIGEVLQMGVLYGIVRFCVHRSEDLLWIGVAQIASTFFVALYYLWYQHNHVTAIRFGATLRSIRDLVQAGFSIGLANMIWAFHQYSPIFFMMLIVAGDETGWFGAGHRLAVSLLTFSYVYHFNLFPEMARRASKSSEALDDLLQSSFRVVAWVGCFGALILALAAEPLLTFLFGSSFSNGATSFAVLIWILPITTLGGHARWALITVGHQRFVMISQIAGALVMLVAGPLLIATQGQVGASIAMVAACLTVWLVAHVFSVRWVGHAPSLGIAFFPLLLGTSILCFTSIADVSISFRFTIAVLAFMLGGPLVDGRLFSSFRFLISAKSPERVPL